MNQLSAVPLLALCGPAVQLLEGPSETAACVGHLVSRVNEGNMEQMLAIGEELGSSELVDAAKAAIRKCSGRASPAGGDDGKGGKVYECMGCRKLLERPPFDGVTADDVAMANEMLDALPSAYK